ncbi:transglutaminaseTgpA domain-containing protein [Halolamina salifodinae]|uniref:Transglutaminase-like putative cysteine protease n=1 Tax=Halolamina salifodinae TaxID=1202767 RepID=A0A8T4GW97_9EURY|nr:transglutaminaseTgpA domain-containing protein [Halolamina salifodinae]MBP1987176.1 transglutaminase-like putative cysteine protease [Halolamina salifodinae]
MSNDNGAIELGADRRWWRVLLTLVCVAAVVLASVALPLFAGDAGAPAAQFDLGQPLSGEGGGAAGDVASSALGALSAVSQTTAGSSESSSASNPYSSLNQQVHFVVRSDQPSYWRTGSFDRYTGQGWERTGDAQPFDGTTPVEGAAGDRIRYEVTLAKSATALPTVWRPQSLSLDSDALQLGPGRAITSQEPVPAGTTYVGESVAPPDDPELLRSAGQDYPREIESTYTGLPAGEDTRQVGAFTDELTADAETPYETATRIESWLESNKEYSLNASHDRENGTITSQFVFEMDQGYCEYFATAMTTMLRSQGIPARYVVGYATGEQTGANEYTVRGMHAHAWVEVYFPEVGWVRFDPTPSADRQAAEEDALESTPTATPAPTPTPTPPAGTATDGNRTTEGTPETVTTGTPTSPTPTPTPTPTEAQSDPSLNVSLNRSAVPGATVQVTVLREGEPVVGAEVLFNGDPVGRTDGNGTVVAEVPYTAELNVTVRTDTAGALPPPSDAPRAVDGYALQTGENTTFTLDTNATISFVGEVRSDAQVTLVATVDDVPVRTATVTLNGEQIGQTDDRGRFELRLPSDPGDYEYAVSRGSVEGAETVTIRSLELNYSVGWPATIPFAPVTLNATLGDEPLPNATVSIDGEAVGTTGVNGTAVRRLPPADSVTLGVSAYGQRATVDIEGLFGTLAQILGGLLAGVGAVFGIAYYRGITPRGLLVRGGRGVRRGYQLVLIAVVSLSDALSRGVEATIAALSTAADRLVELAQALRERTKTPSEVARIIVAALTAWATSTVVTIQTLPERLLAWLRGIRAAESATATRPGVADAAEEDPESAAARERIRQAWQRFLSILPLRRVRTLTPGEVARFAVEDTNLPAGPVERLRDAYREVSYGGADPASRQDVAEAAVDSIDAERAADAEEGGGR